MAEKFITQRYLREHPNHIFVFGDNVKGKGYKGSAQLRDEPNSYGFITKKYPNYDKGSYFKPKEYKVVFEKELTKLINYIEENPDLTFLISRIGGDLANKYGIHQKVILPGLEELRQYPNVEFLWDF